MRYPSGPTTRDVIAGCVEAFARAGKSRAPPASPLRARSSIEPGSEADEASDSLDRKVSEILGGIAGSPRRLLGKDEQTSRQEGKGIMCPVCVTNIALIATGAMSGGGLTAFAADKLYRRKETKQIRGDRKST